MKKLHEQLQEHLQVAFAEEKEQQDYERMMVIAQLVIEAVKKSLADDVYWDIHALAKYLGVSISTVYRHVVNDPRFPEPIVIGDSKQGKRLWLASDCRKALLAFRQRKERDL